MFLNNYFLSDDSFHWLTSNVTSICNLVSWKKAQHNFVSLKNWSSSSMRKKKTNFRLLTQIYLHFSVRMYPGINL
jgi:hypothetical protein